MERVALRQTFHGESDAEGSGERGPDQVHVHVKSGTLELRVPADIPDHRVISKENIDQFMQLVLELEDGSELVVIMEAATDLVDTRLIPAREQNTASEG